MLRAAAPGAGAFAAVVDDGAVDDRACVSVRRALAGASADIILSSKKYV
jgi:hypothetical protein